ncbi:uncharacterized protein SPPG_05370 [Spizellomyces punctatus DAOM BR117]|uniref:Diphthamide biosynthesis protein 4 n=1 Tax=Spizellomyces punctatus (strain DAOM BR117) TaxID=645134 RepID=A0A0L0HC52_SPIPD|nr:uncharacterized protein SPPG_05370 [Spizellomyces punctatus DAOM BR117]KNC99110.1 hypothetical protein SPPG_05370 [Spizellomyces punctatus DAOM BR117]|eukprot:XP_016607150.1 hypothetical protein SPPG_05370 [Spizellomyces punctatus DAOM BR117]
MPTHYEILGVPQTASIEEIRKQYQKLVLQYHPDKLAQTVNSPKSGNVQTGPEECAKRFQEVVAAWEILNDECKRRQYDAELSARRTANIGPIHAEVDLDDMEYDEGKASFHTLCRCGGSYTVSESQLEQQVQTVTCDSCSLQIRLMYQVEEID